ncbi:MAG: helix-turn-helix transcriptional regulator [bacterium]|nr:helix-turn-helix transcriptional regulator [Candidatus Minthenecus merdequi]
MQQKKIFDNERLEAITVCRKFHRICIQKKLYLKGRTDRNECARLMKTNHIYLCRKIKIASGLSLNNFIKAIRLTIAYKLLSTTNYNMTLVLKNCGYSDKSAFYRAFTKRFHCSPTTLRKRFFAN